MKVGLVFTEANRWSYYEDDMWYGYTALGAVLRSARKAFLSEVAEGGSAFYQDSPPSEAPSRSGHRCNSIIPPPPDWLRGSG
jgi:hypothetical protein